MEIKIIKGSNSYLTENIKVLWQFRFKKNAPFLTVYTILGILCILMGIKWKSENESFFNFLTCLGLSFILVVIFFFAILLKAKSKDLTRTKLREKRFNNHNNLSELLITNLSISSKNIDSVLELKWSYFNSFAVYKDHIFIIADNGSQFSIIIKKEDLSDREFQELYGILLLKLKKTT